PSRVRIVEVGPRDGLQNEKQIIPTATKVQLINQLADAGLQTIEAGSFVNPKWVAQMADSAEAFHQLTRKPGVTYAALAPNLQGSARALSAGADGFATCAAASDACRQQKIICSVREYLTRVETLVRAAQAQTIAVRGYMPRGAGSPHYGDVAVNTAS